MKLDKVVAVEDLFFVLLLLFFFLHFPRYLCSYGLSKLDFALLINMRQLLIESYWLSIRYMGRLWKSLKICANPTLLSF